MSNHCNVLSVFVFVWTPGRISLHIVKTNGDPYSIYKQTHSWQAKDAGKGSSQRVFKCVAFDLRKSCIVSPPDVSLSLSADCLSCCIQGLQEPKELLPGSFVLPNLPQKGECLEVRVKHLLTPNEVFTKATGHFLICCPREPHSFYFSFLPCSCFCGL